MSDTYYFIKVSFLYLGMQEDTIFAPNTWGVGLDQKFLPQYLKDLGYKTHAIGKVTYYMQFLHSLLVVC